MILPCVLRPGAQLVVGGGGGEGGVGEGPGGEAEGGVALAWNLKRIGLLCFFGPWRSPDHVMVGVVVVIVLLFFSCWRCFCIIGSMYYTEKL